MSCPHTPEQNGIAERKHRHLTELGLSMLYHSHTPLHHWVEAFFTASYLSNLLPSAALNHLSPHEVLHKQKPNYSSLRIFGSACYPHLRPYAAHKLEPRSLQCVFLGYAPQYKGYRCLHPPTGRVYISRHVIFDENMLPFKHQYQQLIPRYESTILKAWQSTLPSIPIPQPAPQKIALPISCSPPITIESSLSDFALIDADSSTESSSVATVDNSPTTDQEHVTSTLDPSQQPASVQPVSTPPTITNEHPMTTRAKAGVHKPNLRYVLNISRFQTTEPTSITAALKHPGWNQAVHDEIGNIYMLQTWRLVPSTPEMNVLGCRWIFKTKLKPDGSLEKLKARLVAKGFDQEEGVDYLETFSPVVRTATVRVMLDIAVAKDWTIKQLDVSNAFLHGELKEPVFMSQPPGFIDPSRPTHVCMLTKALYGLKQAPRAWFDTFSSYLLEFGFTCSKADPSLFVYYHNSKYLVLLLYVDDILLTGSDPMLLQDLLTSLNTRFSMKDLGQPSYFLGVEVKTHSAGMFLHQSAYAADILHQASMSDCNPMPTPLPIRLDNTDRTPFPELTYFRSLAGKLQYLTITRPDIQFAVNFICQRMHTPTVSDFGLLKRILRYIKGTFHHGLHIRKSHHLTLSAYCDSDWAGCLDTRRSTSGFCTFLGPNLISWSAKRQQTVSRSSTEAEYRALASTAQEITWLSFLLRDLGIAQYSSTLLHCDNLSAVYLSTNPTLHKRSKHFESDYHYIREQVALGNIETSHIPAALQIADIFTKSLPRPAFIHLRAKLGVDVFSPPSLRGNVSSLTTAQLQNSTNQSPTSMRPMKNTKGTNTMHASAKPATNFPILTPKIALPNVGDKGIVTHNKYSILYC